jgi:arabinan endo-1,5-alpha-L-arabinosidase
MTRRRLRRSAPAVLCALACVLGVLAVPAAAAPAPARGDTYSNPVSAGFADTFADPAVVRGTDGWWYAYGTTDPLRSGEGVFHRIPTARSTDLVDWEYVGDAITALPSWAAPDAALWAPDVRYVAGRWVMYYVVTQTTVTDEPNDNAIGVATAPSPTGPWTDSGAPVVGPRRGAGGAGDFQWTFDPAHLIAADGRQYLYYGSYYGGIFATELSADGTRAVGSPTMVAIDNRYEGAYVVPRDGWYYLFASSSNCCAGPVTGYSVFTGRSRSPLGPFVDDRGVPLTASRTGGTIVVTPNGNRWVGTGHNAVVTDLSGQDWLAYHAIDRADPYLDEPFGINRRPMLLDRLDWVRGWPVVRAGAYASAGPQAAPVTRSGDRGRRDDVRASALVRTGAGTAGLRLGRTVVTLSGDRLTANGRSVTVPGLDPADRRRLTVEIRDGVVVAEVGPVGVLDAPVASVRTRGEGGRLTVLGRATDVTTARLYRPVTRAVADPRVGRIRSADEFSTGIGPGWTWVREPAAPPAVTGGALVWPTQTADLTGTGNDASVLLRDTPAGDWTAETKVSLDLGEQTVRNYQQAGLVVYSGDDEFLRLTAVAIWNTRTTEYGKETVFAGQPSYGSMLVAPPADTTWLRLRHTRTATGEHAYRAAVSTDGRTWTWGGTWTLPAGSTARVGLVSHGANPADPPATARFDYLRFLSNR